MSYDPNIMPSNLEEWNQLIDYYLAKEAAKAMADPDYVPQTRGEIEATFSFYMADPNSVGIDN